VYAAVDGAKTTKGELTYEKQGGVQDADCGGNFGVQLRKWEKVSSCRKSLGSGMVIPKWNERQKRENRGKAGRFHGKVQEVSLRER